MWIILLLLIGAVLLIFPFYCYIHNDVMSILIPQLFYSLCVLFISSKSKINMPIKLVVVIVVTLVYNFICQITGLLEIYSLGDGIFISFLSVPSIMTIGWFLEEKDKARNIEKEKERKEYIVSVLKMQNRVYTKILDDIKEFDKNLASITDLMELLNIVSGEDIKSSYLQYRKNEYECFYNKHLWYNMPQVLGELKEYCNEINTIISSNQKEILKINNQDGIYLKSLYKKCVNLEKELISNKISIQEKRDS